MGVKAFSSGLLALSAISSAFAALDASNFKLFEVVEKDVVIIGGGATGAHAAVRLREDYKKSVFVIEKDSVLVRLCLKNKGQRTTNVAEDDKVDTNIAIHRVAMLTPTMTRRERPVTLVSGSTSPTRMPWTLLSGST